MLAPDGGKRRRDHPDSHNRGAEEKAGNVAMKSLQDLVRSQLGRERVHERGC